MNAVFADTSAVAKRYFRETGSDWVRSWSLTGTETVVIIAEICQVEFFSTVARRQKEGSLTFRSATRLANVFLFHAERQYLTVPMELPVLVAARNLTFKYPLRALDAIQLASALQAVKTLNSPLTFVTADQNLLAAASAEGLAADDPTAHS